jgi:hypothetical protein
MWRLPPDIATNATIWRNRRRFLEAHEIGEALHLCDRHSCLARQHRAQNPSSQACRYG